MVDILLFEALARVAHRLQNRSAGAEERAVVRGWAALVTLSTRECALAIQSRGSSASRISIAVRTSHHGSA
jgi:hypothetical protein